MIDDFARGVQETQAAIRRLLDRISLDGLWDTVTGFFTGEGDDILREIANDVGDALENFQSQVKGVVGFLEELVTVTVIGDLATGFQKWIRPGDRRALEEALGLPVGFFDAEGLVRADIPDPGEYDLRVPSGNEAGASDQWLPGGFLPTGTSEAVIDGAEVPADDLTITDMD